VRFSLDSVPCLEDEQLVTKHSLIGDVGLKPDADDEHGSGKIGTSLKAELDFGILREGHSWQASACTLPEGTSLLEAKKGRLITDVVVQSCAGFEGRDEDVDAETMEGSVIPRILVSIKPEGLGPFDEHLELQVSNAAGQTQAIRIRVHGSIMSSKKGTPMAKPGVVCVDPTKH
jgi:hypothetical protein